MSDSINIISFYDDVLDCDFFTQFLKTNVDKSSIVVPHLLGDVIPNFQCKISSGIDDSFNVSIYIVDLASGTTTDITSQLTIVKKKTSNSVYILHLNEQSISGIFGGLVYIEIVANDGLIQIIKYSEIICFSEIKSLVFDEVDQIDSGFNDSLSNYKYVIDGGFNEV